MSEAFPHLRVIGLTGKIGSGKSTARRWFEKKGIPTFDCDAIVHESYQPGQSGAIKIQTLFGDDYLTPEGEVDRKKLLRRLGSDLKKWDILNRMIHPIVVDQLQRRLKKITAPIAVIEIQVYEKRYFEKWLDKLWVIESATTLRHQRLQKRKIGKTFLAAIEEQQKKSLETTARVIRNEENKENLFKKLEEALNQV